MSKSQSWVDKIAKDKNGNLTIWQSPNLPIIVWAVATLASKLITQGRPHQALTLIAFGAIFVWAWLEIFFGVNYFRRALGLTILVLSLYPKLH